MAAHITTTASKARAGFTQLWAAALYANPPAKPAFHRAESRQDCADYQHRKQALFGDLPGHTSYAFEQDGGTGTQ